MPGDTDTRSLRLSGSSIVVRTSLTKRRWKQCRPCLRTHGRRRKRMDFATTCSPHLSSRSEEHTSELQSLMRISYAVFCLKKKIKYQLQNNSEPNTYRHRP